MQWMNAEASLAHTGRHHQGISAGVDMASK
jgi:hypothetical protein